MFGPLVPEGGVVGVAEVIGRLTDSKTTPRILCIVAFDPKSNVVRKNSGKIPREKFTKEIIASHTRRY